jgi:carbon monoxide dehydrogenase subunit G
VQTGGQFTVAVPREQAFRFISDPHRLAGCIPGCSGLEERPGGTYAATLTNKIGPLAISFAVTVELTKVDPPSTIEATIAGDATGAGGRLGARAVVELAASDSATTTVSYAVDMTLAGRLGGIGQPVFRAKSDELSKQFGANVKAELERAAAPR